MKARKLTGEEFAALKPYEENMKTALASDWTRGLGRNGINTMKAIRDAVTGRKNFVNASCPACVLHLCREVGRMYFAYKSELESRAAVETPAPRPEPVVVSRSAEPQGRTLLKGAEKPAETQEGELQEPEENVLVDEGPGRPVKAPEKPRESPEEELPVEEPVEPEKAAVAAPEDAKKEEPASPEKEPVKEPAPEKETRRKTARKSDDERA